MLSVFTGTPGSGKSLHAAEKIFWRLRMGQPLVTNFPVAVPKSCKRARYTFVDNMDLTPSWLIQYSRDLFGDARVKEGAILLIVDEAQLIWGFSFLKGDERKEWLSFFTQHRKLGYDIIAICQFIGMLDKQIRVLVEYEEMHRKVSRMGWKGLFLSALMLSPTLFVSVRVWVPLRERLSAEFFRYRRRLGRLYDTYAEFSLPGDVELASAQVTGDGEAAVTGFATLDDVDLDF